MIKYIWFDADGMLIKREGYFSERIIHEQSIDKQAVEAFFKNEWTDIVVGKVDLKESLSPYLKSWGWNQGIDALLDYWFVSEHHLDEAVIKAVEYLRSQEMLCCLATNQEQYRLEYITNQMGFGQLFDKIYSSCTIGAKKPSEAFFDYIWHDLDKPAKDTILFWDDLPPNIKAARRFGIRAELFSKFSHFEKVMQYNYGLAVSET